MLLKNARIVNGVFDTVQGDVWVEDGRIARIGADCPDDPAVYDMTGLTVIPGLIDLHIHGSAGVQVSDGKVESILKMSRFLAGHGVTGFVPTTVTETPEQLVREAKIISKAAGKTAGARVQGIYMEGPYFSEAKAGAHNPRYLTPPCLNDVLELNRACGGLLKVVCVAPELPGAMDFIRAACQKFCVSLAHSNAGYDTAMAGLAAGATNITHLFNAMTGLHHREPGMVGAAFDSPAGTWVELICDGLHVHPAAIRATIKALGEDKLVLISDALSPAGMPDGAYILGDIPVQVTDGVARTPEGNLAGSTVTLMECLRRAIKFGVPFKTALKAATLHPARVLGIEQDYGSIEEGKVADFVALDETMDIKMVFIGGRPYNRGLMPLE